MKKIDDLIAPGTEAGTGLALIDGSGRYLFILAGTRYRCEPGELFYSGVGGHRREGESWDNCARREAREEIGADIEIEEAMTTWHFPAGRPARTIELGDRPRPLAIYEMVHPAWSPKAGNLYPIVIFNAGLRVPPAELHAEEAGGLLALTREQVRRGPSRKPTLAELLAEGATLQLFRSDLEESIRVYPIGTALALAQLLGRRRPDAR